MKIRKIFIILILFSILAIMSLPAFATSSSNLPKNFNSNGDLTKGWYWLRDNSLQNYAQWTFENIPSGENDLILEITALATDRPNGRKGLPAEFLLIYEVPGGSVFVTQKVTLPNDSFDYTCRGHVTIPRSVLHGASVLFVRAERISSNTNHVAFNKKSIKIIETAEVETYPPYQETQFYPGIQLPDTNNWNEGIIIQPGTYNGSIGGQTAGGQIDREDWYGMDFQKGQTINLQLSMLSNAKFKLYLYRPGNTSSSVISVAPDESNIGILNYLANVSGIWYVKIVCISGEGNYQILTTEETYPPYQEPQFYQGGQLPDTNNQNEAFLIQSGIYNGSLGGQIAGGQTDNNDWYSINLEKGQIINLQLTMPSDASFLLHLHKPKSGSSVGSSQLQGNTRTLQYVANVSGIWHIKVSRSKGEGDYQLRINIQNQNDAGSNQDAGDTSNEAIPLYHPGAYNGFLKIADNNDWYSINLEKGQIINLQLTMPSDASFLLHLHKPKSGSSVGSSQLQGNTRTLQYVANVSGIWHIKVSRSKGEGDYQLRINIQNQNDAGSNQDAGDTSNEAIPLYHPGAYNGFLKIADNNDWYSINLQKGQIINLQLTMPSDASFLLHLHKPKSGSSVGSSQLQGNTRTLQYVANVSGIWHIKVSRSKGEGDYQLSINISGYPSGQIDQSQIVSSQGFTANEFYSNGDLFEGWYWLRDPTRQHYAEWTFENIPPGNTDLTLEITVLATNQAGGGEGFSAKFRLIFGFPGSGSMGGVFQTAEVVLTNDSGGYTCHGVVTIPRDFIPAATTIFLRVERISPNDNHIAFNSESINLFTGEQTTSFREEIQSTGTKK